MRKIIILFFTLASISAFAQKNIEFDSNGITDPEMLELAKSSIFLGDELSKAMYPNFLEIEAVYMDAYEINPYNALLNYKIGKCLLFNYKYFESEKMFKSVINLGGVDDKEFSYFYGRALHFVGKFDEAIELYGKYKDVTNAYDNVAKGYDVNKRIEECVNAKAAMVDTAYVLVRLLEGDINSVYHDYSPVLSKKGDVLFFTSKREGSSGGVLDIDGQYKEDIYQAENYTGDWKNVKKLDKPINSKDNESSVAMSIDGTQMVICREKDVFTSKLSQGSWSTPSIISEHINSPEYESTACFSYDGKRMYFVSNRIYDNRGGTDIFYCERDQNGDWQEPQNLGDVINTKYNEDFVFLHPDGKTMYFASKGHNSMGGYDIYQTKMNDDGSWEKPLNMGYPINTSADEVSFVLSPDGKEAYVASSRVGGRGFTDIYVVKILGKRPSYVFEEKDLLVVYPRAELNSEDSPLLTIVQGRVYDENKENALQVKIQIANAETGEDITSVNTQKGDGRYVISLPSGKNYALSICKKGYLLYSKNIEVPQGQRYKELEYDVVMKKLVVGNAVTLSNVFFEKGTSVLKKGSAKELDHVVEMLQKNSKIKIEITACADDESVGKNRAQAIVDYLAKSIDKNRIVAVGKLAEKVEFAEKVEVKIVGLK